MLYLHIICLLHCIYYTSLYLTYNYIYLYTGILDLSEAVTQSLLQDVTGLSFSIFNTNSIDTTQLPQRPIILAGQREIENNRIIRQAYYNVLLMTDEQLRTSYMIKSAEEYKAQLKEDELVEKYWLTRLTLLEKDYD